MNPDWKRNNKIGLRNFSENVDLHDLVKTLLCRMLRRNYPDSNKYPIYTEYNPARPNDDYPDIWMSIKSDIYIWEIQDKLTSSWVKQILEKHKHATVIMVPLKLVENAWKSKIRKLKNPDPIKLLREVLKDYVI